MECLESVKSYLQSFQRNYVEKYTQSFLRFSTVSAMILHILRRPTWTYDTKDWGDLSLYPAFGISKFPSGPTYVVTMMLLMLNQWCLQTFLYTPHVREKLPKTRVKILSNAALPLVAIKLVDAVVQVIVYYAFGRTYWSLSPWEAVIFIVCEPCFESKLYKTMWRSLSYFGGLMFLFFTVVLSWTVLEITLLFGDNTIPSVSALDDSMWKMLMILNTANWPTPVIQFYEKGTIQYVFFIAYSVVCDWGFLNLVLGLIVAFFEEAFTAPSKSELKALEAQRQAEAREAGDDEDESSKSGDNDLKPIEDATQKERISMPLDVVNPMNEEGVDVSKFGDQSESVKEVKNFEIDTLDGAQRGEDKMSWVHTNLTPVVEGRKFSLLCDVVFSVLGFNFIFGSNPVTILNIQIVLNALELMLRLFVRTTSLYEWSTIFRNISNAVFITVLVSHSVVYFWFCKSSDFGLNNQEVCSSHALNKQIYSWMDPVVVYLIIVIRFCILVRITLVFRNLSVDYVPEYYQLHMMRVWKIIAETSDALGHLVIMLLTTMYMFASLGEHLYGGKLSKNPDLPDHEALLDSYYGQSGYWPLNFNDCPSALLTMFTLLYINNMQIITSGCSAVTTRWSEVFFGSFYIIGVLYVRNVFTSFLWSRIGKILDPDCDPIEWKPDAEHESAVGVNDAQKEEKRDTFSDVSPSENLVKLHNLRNHQKVSPSDNSSAEPHTVDDETTQSAATKTENVLFEQPKSPSKDHGNNFIENILDPINNENFEKGLGKNRGISIEEDLGVILLNARYGSINEPFMDRLSLWAFKIRSRMFRAVLISCWLLTLVRIFQTPPWILNSNESLSTLKETYMFADTPFLSAKTTALIKVPLLLTLQTMLLLEVLSKKDMTLSKTSYFMRYFLITICFTSMVALLVGINGNPTARRIDWYFSFFSVLYTFWFDRNAMKRIIIVIGVIPKLMALLVVFGIFIAIAAVFGDVTFDPSDMEHGDDDYNAAFYKDYPKSVWTTFTALTSSSFPQQFMPATRSYREFALYFMVVISVGGFVILEGSIAVVNTAYQVGVSLSNVHIAKTKKLALMHVFELMCSEVDLAIVEDYQGKRIVSSEKYASESEDPANLDVAASENRNRVDIRIDISFANIPSSILDNLDPLGRPGRANVVASHIIDALFAEIYSSYGEFKKVSDPDAGGRAILRTLLDIDGNGLVCKYDFQFFYHVARIKVRKVKSNFLTTKEKKAFKEEKTISRAIIARSANGWDKFGALARIKREEYSAQLHDYVEHTSVLGSLEKKHWSMIMDSITGVLGLACNVASNNNHKTLATILLVLLIIEFFAKWFLMGIQTYFRDKRYVIDFFIMIIMLIIMISGSASGKLWNSNMGLLNERNGYVVSLSIIEMARLFFYPRNVAIFSAPVNGVAWKSVFGTVFKLSFAFAEAFICLGFTFAQLGVLFFGGVIPREGVSAALDKSPFGQNKFWILSFNDMTSSFFTLFACLRVSDWDVVTQGVVTMTGEEHWRGFFSAWYVFGVLLMLNILKSYFVVVFRSRPRKYDAQNDSEQTHLAHDGDGESYIDKEITQSKVAYQNETKKKYGSVASKEIEDEEDECERLEQMNVKGGFIVDLAELYRRPDFIPTPSDKPNFISEIQKLNQSRRSLRTVDAANLSLHGEALESMNSVDSTISNLSELDPESTAKRAIARNKFRYMIKFPFKQGMEAAERLPILRRMEQISME